MRTLYVTDLDGTLMKNDMTVSDDSVRILNQLIDRGVLITYATARSFHSAYEITKDIRFKIPVITRNGTTLADQISAKEKETAFFAADILKELKGLLPVISICGFTSVYIDGEMYKMYQGGEKSKEFQGYIDYYQSIGDKRMRMVNDAEKQFEGNISYITLISSREELLPYYEAVKGSVDACHKKWLEVTKEFVTAKHMSFIKFQKLCREIIEDFDKIEL